MRTPGIVAPSRPRALSPSLLAALYAGLAIAPLRAQTPAPARARTPEALFYLVDAPDALASFQRHADQVTVVGPQSFRVDGQGTLTGAVPAPVLETARRHGVKVMPLVVNPGWNLELFHALVHDPAARARLIARMVALGRQNGYWGWQFDFEQIQVGDRDALTRLAREAATALHGNGMTLSIAVYPDPGAGEPGDSTPYQTWLRSYLTGAYDLKALAEAADFLSLMTYLQHTPRTPPGPVGGVPYMERVVRYALALGVPPDRLSLGIPFFSMHWYTDWSPERKGFSWARGLDWAAATGLVRRFHGALQWDTIAGAEEAHWERAGTREYAWIEDARALRPKLDLQRRFGLRGISVWRIGNEDPAVWPVLAAWLRSAR